MAANGSTPVILGRDAELDRIRQLIDRVTAGTGDVLRIDGEPGIGKTALLEQLTTEAALRGCAVRGAAADRSYGPHALLERLDLPAGDPDAIRAAVEQRCDEAPLVLVIDDAHQADDALLQRLARLAEELPLLLVTAARPTRADGGSRVSATRITLPPLDRATSAQLAARLAGATGIGPRMRAQLQHTAGNPGLLGELVRTRHLEVVDGRAELVAAEPPHSSAESIIARLDFIDETTCELLRIAALLGSPFSVTELRAVSEQPMIELTGRLGEALRTGLLLESGPRLTFQHELVRQALRETTPTPLRVALHHQAAQALQSSGAPAERVGEQLLASVNLADAEFDDWGMNWLAEHARALAQHSPDCAEQLLTIAVGKLPRHDRRRAELRVSKVLALVQLNRPGQVRELAREMLAEEGEQSHAAELNWYLTWSLATLGLTGEATEVAEKALHTPGFERPWSARTQAVLGRALLAEDRFEDAYLAVERAADEARAANDPYALGLALHVRGSGLARQCDLTEAVVCLEEATAALGDAREHTDLRLQVLSDRMMLLFALGRSDEADRALHELLAIAESSATWNRLAAIRLSAAYHYFTVGRWDDATAELEAASELTAHMSEPDRSRLHGLSAMIAGQRDDNESFRGHLDRLGPASRGFPLVAEVMRAEIDGETELAVQLLTGFLHRGDRFATRYVFLPQLVRLAVEIGDTGTAAEANDACAQDASVGAVPNILAASQHCRGLLDRDPPALRAAIELYRKTNQTPKCARALEDLALLQAERGEQTAARKSYAEAVEIFQALGAAWDLRRIDSAMHAHGLQRPRKRKQRASTGWEALTNTERRIALLVGDGLANPEIAAALSSSRRTVEVHVSHVLSKLGARSRVEIAVEATKHREVEDSA
ncbi:LuxR family transcriptional regulator [Saccharopolyspora halophila]|uniref:LuxR family transcriptional regulator n=1 Tax=Saccharopolyspora halophila TaxID=405551 RepID=A0ABN3G880_9PSEU